MHALSKNRLYCDVVRRARAHSKKGIQVVRTPSRDSARSSSNQLFTSHGISSAGSAKAPFPTMPARDSMAVTASRPIPRPFCPRPEVKNQAKQSQDSSSNFTRTMSWDSIRRSREEPPKSSRSISRSRSREREGRVEMSKQFVVQIQIGGQTNPRTLVQSQPSNLRRLAELKQSIGGHFSYSLAKQPEQPITITVTAPDEQLGPPPSLPKDIPKSNPAPAHPVAQVVNSSSPALIGAISKNTQPISPPQPTKPQPPKAQPVVLPPSKQDQQQLQSIPLAKVQQIKPSIKSPTPVALKQQTVPQRSFSGLASKPKTKPKPQKGASQRYISGDEYDALQSKQPKLQVPADLSQSDPTVSIKLSNILKQQQIRKQVSESKAAKGTKQQSSRRLNYSQNQIVESKTGHPKGEQKSKAKSGLWQKVLRRINLMNMLVAYIGPNRKLMNEVYPDWLLSSYLVYRRFILEREECLLSLEDSRPERLKKWMHTQVSQAEFSELRAAYDSQIKKLQGQNEQARISCRNIQQKLTKSHNKQLKELKEMAEKDLGFDTLYEGLMDEVNALRKHKDLKVQAYLCHKLDCLLIVLDLEGARRFEQSEKSKIETGPREYLARRIEQLNDQEQVKPAKEKFTYQKLVEMASTRYLSGFGEMFCSEKPSSPAFSFCKGQRAASPKIYHCEEMAQIDTAGREGGGPAAFFEEGNRKDYFCYKSAPAWKYINREDTCRMEIKPRYHFYELTPEQDTLDINASDKYRRASSAKLVIARPRPKNNFVRTTPGPQYDIGKRPQTADPPSYSFGFKRVIKGSDPLAPMCETGKEVGPGAYFVEPPAQKSGLVKRSRPGPKYSMGREKRFARKRSTENCIDQTYDVKSRTLMATYDFNYDGGKGMVPEQPLTARAASANPGLKTKMLSYSFGKSKRNDRRGHFRDMMSTLEHRCRIPMPKF